MRWKSMGSRLTSKKDASTFPIFSAIRLGSKSPFGFYDPLL
jgi:hypothetical protein